MFNAMVALGNKTEMLKSFFAPLFSYVPTFYLDYFQLIAA